MTDGDKAGQWGETASGANANRGTIILAADDGEVAGKIVVVEKGDGGVNAAGKACTLEYAGALRFPVKNAVTLTAADKGKKILGAGDGFVKPVAEPSSLADVPAQVAYFKRAKGRVVAFSNADGEKWVDVVGNFG